MMLPEIQLHSSLDRGLSLYMCLPEIIIFKHSKYVCVSGGKKEKESHKHSKHVNSIKKTRTSAALLYDE
jgi:hypothetical protein